MAIKRFCPQCGSEDVDFSSEDEGDMLCCQNCGFSDSSFPEHDIDSSEEDGEILKDIDEAVVQIRKKINKSNIGNKVMKKNAKKKAGKKR